MKGILKIGMVLLTAYSAFAVSSGYTAYQAIASSPAKRLLR